jgi:hypothetical protein
MIRNLPARWDLKHNEMRFDPDRFTIDRNVAIVSGVAGSGGTYKGQAFLTLERATDVHVRRGPAALLPDQLSPLVRR